MKKIIPCLRKLTVIFLILTLLVLNGCSNEKPTTSESSKGWEVVGSDSQTQSVDDSVSDANGSASSDITDISSDIYSGNGGDSGSMISSDNTNQVSSENFVSSDDGAKDTFNTNTQNNSSNSNTSSEVEDTGTSAGSLNIIRPEISSNQESGSSAPTHTVSLAYHRGVNMSGAEFGDFSGGEGNQYGWNGEASYKYFAEKGFDLFRVPFLWGRIQPVLNGPLDQNYLAGLKRQVQYAKKYGGLVVLDLHDYGGYSNGTISGKINGKDGVVTLKNYIDLWIKLSNEFKNEDAIYAYGIMNEPHDMNGGDWYEISQEVVTAIRNNGDTHTISVPNDNWTGAHSWPTNKEPWITDPLNNIIYEAHQYFDNDSSGTYTRTYDQELRIHPDLATIGVSRMKGFVEWCNKYNVRGFMGEFSVPNNDSRWLTVLENFMTYLDENGIDSAFWAAGERWAPDEKLSVQPSNNYTVDKIQMSVLGRHLPGIADVPWEIK